MAKVHVLSANARLYPLAHRLALEGHDVEYFTSPAYQPTFLWGQDRGPQVQYKAPESAADFYLLDSRGLGGFGADLVRERKMVLGGCRLTVRVEADRAYHDKLVSQVFPPVKTDLPETPLTCTLFGYYAGDRWLEPQGLLLHQSRLMEGERGPHLGISGMLLTQLSGRLLQESSSPHLAEFLAHASYRGPVSLSVRVGPEALHIDGIDFSLTTPALLAWQEVSKTPLYETLFGLCSGMLKRPHWRNDPFVVGVKLSFTPPAEENGVGELVQVSDYKHIWPDAGVTPPVLHLAWVTARGIDTQEARRRAYRTIGLIKPVPLVQYRRDIGAALDNQLKQLTEWGWM